MSLLNKCFRIIENDEELNSQFPELEVGVEFKVVEVDKEFPEAITAIQVRNGPYIHALRRGSHFWCLYYEDKGILLKEIEELASDQYGSSEDIPRNLFRGCDITSQLYAAAGQENCDSEEYDLMQAAADYIRYLEAQIEFNSKKF